MGIKQQRKGIEYFLGRAILSNRHSHIHTDTFISIRNTAAHTNAHNATKNNAAHNNANIFATSPSINTAINIISAIIPTIIRAIIRAVTALTCRRTIKTIHNAIFMDRNITIRAGIRVGMCIVLLALFLSMTLLTSKNIHAQSAETSNQTNNRIDSNRAAGNGSAGNGSADSRNPGSRTAGNGIVHTGVVYDTVLESNFDCTQIDTLAISECETLVALYESTNGLYWQTPPIENFGAETLWVEQAELTGTVYPGGLHPDINWLQSDDPCRWRGVTCLNQRVISIELDGHNLVGALPPALGELTKLTTLELGNNEITSLPDEIDQLQELHWLGLRNNRLTHLPTSLGRLRALTTLQLGGNDLDTLPDSLAELTNLTRLDLKNNQLSTVPEQMGQLANLVGLDMSGNQLDTLPPSFADLDQITTLDISGNLWRVLPQEVFALSKLEWLYAGNGVLETIPPEIGQLSTLQALDVHNNQLTAIPPELGQLQKLIRLDLKANLLTALPAELGDLPDLNTLDVTFNQLQRVPDVLLARFGDTWPVDQLISPVGVTVLPNIISQANTSVQVQWDTMPTQTGVGHFAIQYAMHPNGPYGPEQVTLSRTVQEHLVDALVPGQTYYFIIRAYIPAIEGEHREQWGEPSEPVSITLPMLTVEHTVGRPGTFFPIEASTLPPETYVTIFINNRVLEEQVQVDDNGYLWLILDTTDADWGHYTAEIVMIAELSNVVLSFEFELREGADLIPSNIDGVSSGAPQVIRVPPGLVQNSLQVYLPIVER
ncbi:MAG: leucine-rich repeat domain-containing protein [Chloroflexota bacterium]